MGSISPRRVSIVVVGAGVIGSKHADLIAHSEEAMLAGIVDPTPTGKQLADKYGCAYFHDIAAMLDSTFKPDAAVVCTPNATHVPISMDLARAGIHLLIEKPMSTSLAEGRGLLNFCHDQGVRVCVGHHRRFHSQISTAKSSIQSGSIGDLVGVSGLWATQKPDSYFQGSGKWRASASGGVVYINLIHEIDLLQYLIGRIMRVTVEQAKSTRGNPAVEGLAMTFRFDSGVVGTFLALDNAPSPFSLERNTGENPVFPFSGKDSYRLFGMKGTMSVPDNTLWHLATPEEAWYSELFETQLQCKSIDPYQKQLRNFVNVVRGIDEPTCSGEDGLAAVAVCDAITKSLESNSTIEIESISA